MTPSDISDVLRKATVPEHSVSFMEAMAGGEAFLNGPYLFLAAEDWLLAIGYPLEGEYSPAAFEGELSGALRRTKARRCWAACPALPGSLKQHMCQQDRYYVLPLDNAMPARLARITDRAAASLRVEEVKVFTAEHRRLWAEFMKRDLPPNVLEMYARTEAVLGKAHGVSLLNAWDANGRLAAALLIDWAPTRFASYLIGAHGRTLSTAHASDLLFRAMIESARDRGKSFLHLGLGVNDGIRRFKTKWGGQSGLNYEMAEWRENGNAGVDVGALVRVMTAQPSAARSTVAAAPEQRRFRMLWELEKNGKRSWLGGTAHFFRYSFENSFRRLFESAQTIIFEGPLDTASMDQVAAAGRTPPASGARLIDALSEEDIRALERVVVGPRGLLARFFGIETTNPPDVRHFLGSTRPWMAFFSLWSAYLARKGWTGSVDLEAWRLAHELGKRVHTMETIPEQIETLESIPVPRIVNYLRKCREWDGYARRNIRAYLKGDLEAMMGTSTEFPTRTEQVIHQRDLQFLACMLPFLEEGGAVVLVGSAHLLNLRVMLAEAGFDVRKAR